MRRFLFRQEWVRDLKMPCMFPFIDILYVVKRPSQIQVLYYCPFCEAVNELCCTHDLWDISCRDCERRVRATHSVMELIVADCDDAALYYSN